MKHKTFETIDKGDNNLRWMQTLEIKVKKIKNQQKPDKLPPVSGWDDPLAGEKPLKDGLGDHHQPHLRLSPEQGHLLLLQDHVVVVKPEKGRVLQSSFFEVGSEIHWHLDIFETWEFLGACQARIRSGLYGLW